MSQLFPGRETGHAPSDRAPGPPPGERAPELPPGAIWELLFPGLVTRGQATRWGRHVRPVIRTVIVVVACGLIVGGSIGFAGPLGLTVAADCLAGLALLFLLIRVPQGSAGQTLQALADTLSRVTGGRLPPGRRHRSPVHPADFPNFLKISSDLSWASVSMWHYDHGTRPLLARVMQSALAERHHLDSAADPARARQLVGDDLWPLIDPAGQLSQDSRAPGVDQQTLSRIVDRLERL